MLKDWLAPSRTALLLIDMQRDFAKPITMPAIHQAETLADAARAAGVACIFVRLITTEESPFFLEWKSRRSEKDSPLCLEGTPGAEFVGPQPQAGELVFTKKRYDAFSGTGLDSELRGQGIDTLVVAGLTTECCITSSVHGAFARDYHVFIAHDATACYDPALHQASLKALKLNCAGIVSAAQLRGAWKS